MANAISNCYYRRVVASAHTFITVVGFVLVTSLLVLVTQNKFEALRSKIRAQDVEVVTAAERTKQLECLSRNIYWEAAGESFEGKVAVAQVTLNRVSDGRFGNGVCEVVYQKNIIYEKVICQFSWVCEKASQIKPVQPKLYSESEEVAKKVLLENFRLPSLTNAIYYHADYVNPRWGKPKIVQIGHHIFYEE